MKHIKSKRHILLCLVLCIFHSANGKMHFQEKRRFKSQEIPNIMGWNSDGKKLAFCKTPNTTIHVRIFEQDSLRYITDALMHPHSQQFYSFLWHPQEANTLLCITKEANRKTGHLVGLLDSHRCKITPKKLLRLFIPEGTLTWIQHKPVGICKTLLSYMYFDVLTEQPITVFEKTQIHNLDIQHIQLNPHTANLAAFGFVDGSLGIYYIMLRKKKYFSRLQENALIP